jgi:transposase
MPPDSSSRGHRKGALDSQPQVIKFNHCDGGKSCQTVAEKMGVGRTQIMNILQRKREIFDDFENNVSSSTSCFAGA